MKAVIKPMRNLEDVKSIRVGDVVGIDQSFTSPVYSLCVKHEGGKISLIGDLHDGVNIKHHPLMKYHFTEDDIEEFYNDSMRVPSGKKNRIFVEEDSKEYNPLRRKLVDAGISEEEK